MRATDCCNAGEKDYAITMNGIALYGTTVAPLTRIGSEVAEFLYTSGKPYTKKAAPNGAAFVSNE